MKGFQTITVALLSVIATLLLVMVLGENSPVFAEPESVPANALPVRCYAFGLDPDEILHFSCNRGDTDAGFTTIPTGQYLIITDIHVRSRSSNSGLSEVGVSKSSGGANFSFQLYYDENRFLNSTAPLVIAPAGDTLRASSPSNSTNIMDVFAFGFLVDEVTYQAFFQAYLPIATKP